jgi:lysozyme
MSMKRSSFRIPAVSALVAVGPFACSGAGAPLHEAVGSSRAADSTVCTDGPYVDGIDVYDGTGAIDWNAVKASGFTFAIIKATQGNYDRQTTFAGNWAGAKDAGVVRGAYHFFDPTVDGSLQAEYFLGVMGTLEPGDMPPMLDIECPDGDPNCMYPGGSGAESANVIQARANDWLSAVQAKTGSAPIVYSFGTYFSSNGIDTMGLEAYPLDIAYPTTSNCFDVPSPWQGATFWQNSWTTMVGGISGAIDTDRFLGSPSQFRGFLVGSAWEAGASDAGAEGMTSRAVDSGIDSSLESAAFAPESGTDAPLESPASAPESGTSSSPSGPRLAGLMGGARARDCGCRVGRNAEGQPPWLVWAAGAGLAMAARRRSIRGIE